MGNKCEEAKRSKYLTYLNTNNLYGWAMSQDLPTSGFDWMAERELTNWRTFSKVKGVGCILEVDLEYPDELHDFHNDYPLAPENIKVKKVHKLISNLNNKKKYVVHYKNLQLYERLGLRITKYHRGIKFYETRWLNRQDH